MFASGAPTAMAFARSRTILALVLNKSIKQLTPADNPDQRPQTITGHSRFSGDSSRDDHNLCTLEGVLETIVGWFIASDLGFGINVTNIGSNTYQVSITGNEYG